MKGDRVINISTDALRLQGRLQLVAIGNPDDILVEDMPVRDGRGKGELTRAFRRIRQFRFQKQLFIFLGVTLPSSRPVIEMPEFDSYNRCLNCIQPKISSNNLMMIFRFRAVATQARQPFRTFRIIPDHHACVSGSAEVLRRDEGETSVMADGPGASTAVLAAQLLSSSLNYNQPMLASRAHHRVHLGHLSVQMYWDDRARSGRYF